MRNKASLGFVAVILLGLAGCSSVPDAVNPVSWYRDITGVSKNDKLGEGQNEQNLKEGSNEPYPNLGSVPDAPDNALSSIDRDKLVNSLIADRNNAKYSSDDLRPGRTGATAPPPPPSEPPAPAAGPAPSTSEAAPPPSPIPAPAASAAPNVTANASAAAAPSPPTAPASTQAAPAPAPATQQRRSPARGSEAPAAESSLQSPTVSSVPQGEAVTPAPPPPQLPPPEAVASAAPPAPATRAKPRNAPTQQASIPAATPGAMRHPAISYRIGDIAFTNGSALLADKQRDAIAEIVKLHDENGGSIRIVGHAEAAGNDAAVTALNLALDRAQAVAVALTDRGVSAKDISVEAAPIAAKGGADVPRAEIYLEQ